MTEIRTEAELRALYPDAPVPASTVKVADRITPEYRAWIEASPFCALATVGPEGLDCSPRGDDGPVVAVLDERTLALPDRRGNNRIDSLLNVVRDPRVSLMFLIPGSATVIRVNGRGRIDADPDLLDGLSHGDRLPRSVLLVEVVEVYFQCARAVHRAGLWSGRAAPDTLPTPGDILAAMTAGDFDGKTYDTEWPARAAQTMW